MKPSLYLRLVRIMCCLTLLITGCRGIGTQRFTALGPAQAREMQKSSRIVLDVVYHPEGERADYNLRENLSMLAPTPKRWKLDSTLQVEHVVKGAFDAKTLQIHWLRSFTQEQYDMLGIASYYYCNLTNGTRLRVGFDGYSGKKLKHLKIALQP